MEYNEFIQQKTEHEHITIYTTQCGLSLPTTANNNNNQSINRNDFICYFVYLDPAGISNNSYSYTHWCQATLSNFPTHFTF